MASNSTEILHDFFPLVKVYKDGRVERILGKDVVPPGIDESTGVESKDVTICSDPNVSARLYLPKNAKSSQKLPLVVYFHGGGFIIESAFSPTYQRHMNEIAAEANVVIVSVDYRRAPEHPLPAAYEDCWLAVKWVASHSKDGTDSWLKDYADFNKVYFGGDSAGGNLAHQMALKLSIENLEGLNLVGMFLTCPYFGGKDPIGREPSRSDAKKFLDKLWPFLYPNSTGLDDPLLNPAMDPNLSSLGCKKILVFVAGKDGLRDRGCHYKETLKSKNWNGEIQVVEFEEEDHVFCLNYPDTQNAKSMIKTVASFINQNGA